MQNHPFMNLLVFVSVVVAILGFSHSRRFSSPRPPWVTVLAVLPPAVTLVLFFSLAAHMYRALGGWPSSLGDAGFPPSLAAHSYIAQRCFGLLVVSTLFVLPVVALVCGFAPPLHRWLRLVGIHGAACSICFGSMLLAPSSFLDWWWD